MPLLQPQLFKQRRVKLIFQRTAGVGFHSVQDGIHPLQIYKAHKCFESAIKPVTNEVKDKDLGYSPSNRHWDHVGDL